MEIKLDSRIYHIPTNKWGLIIEINYNVFLFNEETRYDIILDSGEVILFVGKEDILIESQYIMTII